MSIIHADIIERYDSMLARYTKRVECVPIPGTYPEHLRWMLSELKSFTDVGKANRWLGFIQGSMIAKNITSVQVERDFTRPYFTSQVPA